MSFKFTQPESEPFELNETSCSSVFFWYTYLFVIRRYLTATAWTHGDFMRNSKGLRLLVDAINSNLNPD